MKKMQSLFLFPRITCFNPTALLVCFFPYLISPDDALDEMKIYPPVQFVLIFQDYLLRPTTSKLILGTSIIRKGQTLIGDSGRTKHKKVVKQTAAAYLKHI